VRDVKELISWGEHGINVVGGPPVSVHKCDRRSTDHSDGAGTSVNSCTGSKVNEQLFDLTRCETGAAHTLSSSLAAR
jgi:hypothetical protein